MKSSTPCLHFHILTERSLQEENRENTGRLGSVQDGSVAEISCVRQAGLSLCQWLHTQLMEAVLYCLSEKYTCEVADGGKFDIKVYSSSC